VLPPTSAIAPGAMMTTTPRIPIAIPTSWPTLRLSTRNTAHAMIAVMIGVVALKILASPDDTCCSAHANSRNGTTQKLSESTLRWPQMRRSRGRRSRRIATIAASARAPKSRRPPATCAGVMPVRAIAMKRKLEPHTMPVSTNCTAIETGDGEEEDATIPTIGPRCDTARRGGVRRRKSAEVRQP
jgi:hypothetical protein